MSEIHQLIPKIMGQVGAIAKGRTNQHQNYKFRGIDDAYAAFQPLFAEHGVFVVPTVLKSTREERENKSGGLLIYTTLEVKHTFFASDGSNLDCVTVGEAMDSGDKSSNKAMSAAMKYALLEVFCVPTEADNDTENHSPEPLAKSQPQSTPKPAPTQPVASQSEEKAIQETDATFESWTVKSGKSKKSGKPYDLYTLTFTDDSGNTLKMTTFKGEPDKMDVLKGVVVTVKYKKDWKDEGWQLVSMSPVDDLPV